MADNVLDRTTQLRSLAKKYPVANQQAADRIKATQDMTTLSNLQAINQGKPVDIGQQAIAAQQAVQKATTQQQAANIEDATQINQMALQNQQLQRQDALQRQQLALQTQNRENQNKFNLLSETNKKELFDKQLQFEEDEMGRKYLNERQLADWAILKAKGAEELEAFEQQMTQEFTKRMQVMKTVQAKIVQEMQQQFDKTEQERDNVLLKKLTEAKIAAEKKLQQQKAEASQMAAIFQAVGTIGGAVIGGVATGGSPMGAMAGASIGGGVASIASSAINTNRS